MSSKESHVHLHVVLVNGHTESARRYRVGGTPVIISLWGGLGWFGSSELKMQYSVRQRVLDISLSDGHALQLSHLAITERSIPMALTAPTITGYSGFWNTTGDNTFVTESLGQTRAKKAWLIAKLFRGTGTRDVRGALAALIGAGAGGTATNQWSRVGNPAGPSMAVPQVTGIGDLGGLRTIETATAINRATTAADISELKKWINASTLLEQGITYPTQTGSGGGGMIKGGMSSFSTPNTL